MTTVYEKLETLTGSATVINYRTGEKIEFVANYLASTTFTFQRVGNDIVILSCVLDTPNQSVVSSMIVACYPSDKFGVRIY